MYNLQQASFSRKPLAARPKHANSYLLLGFIWITASVEIWTPPVKWFEWFRGFHVGRLDPNWFLWILWIHKCAKLFWARACKIFFDHYPNHHSHMPPSHKLSPSAASQASQETSHSASQPESSQTISQPTRNRNSHPNANHRPWFLLTPGESPTNKPIHATLGRLEETLGPGNPNAD